MQRAEEIDREMYERYQHQTHDADDRRESRALIRIDHGVAHDQISDEQQEDEQGRRESRVPRPPRAPYRFAP